MADTTSNQPVIDTSDGAVGTAAPSIAQQIGGTDGTNLRAISTDTTGKVNINNISGVVSLPTGAATSANQTNGTQTTQINNGATTMAVKAASTAAAAADPSAVVALSPNSPIPTGTNSIGAVTQATASNFNAQVVGNVASGLTDSGNPIKIGGTFNTSFPTLTNGQRGDVQLDSSARQIISPLTNTSVVKSQLQDNSGTAITLGQKVMVSSVPVTLASDQSTITVQGPSGAAGTPSGGILTIQGVSGGSNVNVSQATAANLQSTARLNDGAGNSITSSTVPGTAASKQGLDIVTLSPVTNYYSAPVSIRQSATTAANGTVWTMRNAAASTKTVILERIYLLISFDVATPLTRSFQRYDLVRFSAATPTGGTAITVVLQDSSNPATQVTDVRFLDTGLTTTSVSFGTAFATIGIPASDGATNTYFRDKVGFKLAPGEGFAIRLNNTAVIGQGLSGEIVWSER